MILRFMNNARFLNFDNHWVCLIILCSLHHQRRVSQPTSRKHQDPYTKKSGQRCDLGAAFLFYEGFEEVDRTTPGVRFLYEDFIRHLIPLGGQWPVISMTRSDNRRKYWRTTGKDPLTKSQATFDAFVYDAGCWQRLVIFILPVSYREGKFCWRYTSGGGPGLTI